MDDEEFQDLIGQLRGVSDIRLVQALVALILELEVRFRAALADSEREAEFAEAPWRNPKGPGKGRRSGGGRRRGPY